MGEATNRWSSSAAPSRLPAFTGVGQPGNDSVGTRKELIHGQKLVTVYRVTSLLMFNGQLALARQTQEQSDSCD